MKDTYIFNKDCKLTNAEMSKIVEMADKLFQDKEPFSIYYDTKSYYLRWSEDDKFYEMNYMDFIFKYIAPAIYFSTVVTYDTTVICYVYAVRGEVDDNEPVPDLYNLLLFNDSIIDYIYEDYKQLLDVITVISCHYQESDPI